MPLVLGNAQTQNPIMKNAASALRNPPGNLGRRRPSNEKVLSWIEQTAELCEPDQIFWCDGSDEENAFLVEQAVADGVLLKLNQEKLPGCYYHRSNPNDVARVEQCTYICTPAKDEAGPTNNWAAPGEMYTKLFNMLQGAMKGRTMYVVP